jgi:hypothetical protein
VSAEALGGAGSPGRLCLPREIPGYSLLGGLVLPGGLSVCRARYLPPALALRAAAPAERPPRVGGVGLGLWPKGARAHACIAQGWEQLNFSNRSRLRRPHKKTQVPTRM